MPSLASTSEENSKGAPGPEATERALTETLWFRKLCCSLPPFGLKQESEFSFALGPSPGSLTSLEADEVAVSPGGSGEALVLAKARN